MKKLVISILSILLTFTLASCSTGDVTEEQELIGRIITHEDFVNEMSKRINLDEYDLEFTDYGTSADYRYTCKTEREIAPSESNFQVQIDGISFAMPLTIEEFLDLGFEIISLYGEVTDPIVLPATARSASLGIKTPKGNTFRVYAISEDYSIVAFEDLIVTQVSCDFYEGSVRYNDGERKDAPDIRFFENITGKSTVDSIIKELKAPRAIHFGRSWDNGKTTLAFLYFTYDFSNEKYNGDISITTYTVRDEKIAQTSYVTSLSYRIPYESLKNH